MAKGGGSEIGPTKRGKGLKIMAIVDRHGLPLSVSTPAANHHEVRLVQLCFDFYMIEAKPANLIGDRAYDSDPLDEQLRRDGIEMIAPHRSNRSKPATQICRRRTIIVGGVGRRAVIITRRRWIIWLCRRVSERATNRQCDERQPTQTRTARSPPKPEQYVFVQRRIGGSKARKRGNSGDRRAFVHKSPGSATSYRCAATAVATAGPARARTAAMTSRNFIVISICCRSRRAISLTLNLTDEIAKTASAGRASFSWITKVKTVRRCDPLKMQCRPHMPARQVPRNVHGPRLGPPPDGDESLP